MLLNFFEVDCVFLKRLISLQFGSPFPKFYCGIATDIFSCCETCKVACHSRAQCSGTTIENCRSEWDVSFAF